MAACRPPENSELVLQRDKVDIASIDEVRGAPVGTEVLLLDLKSNHVRIFVAPIDVIDRHREASVYGIETCHGPKQVGCKRGNTAFARQVVAEKRDGSNTGGYFHNLDPPSSFSLPSQWRTASSAVNLRFISGQW